MPRADAGGSTFRSTYGSYGAGGSDIDSAEDEPASVGRRTGALFITFLGPNIVNVIPVLGWIVGFGLSIWNLILYRRGQDLGARVLGMRVVRDTGDLAGFYHMWTRGLAAGFLSALPLGAGYWTAFFDSERRTWHDKIMGTYVLMDSPGLADRPGTSSEAAKYWFWIPWIIGGFILVLALIIVFG